MIRLVWWTALALVAASAWIAYARRSEPAEVALSIENQGKRVALARATALVARRPLPAEHLLLLSAARLRAGDRTGVEQALRLATTRGWRVEAVQLVAARAAIARGDAAAAANRVAALWAIGGSARDLPDLTRAVLALPGGPEALGRQVGRTRVWRDGFIRRTPEFGTPAQVERLLTAAEREERMREAATPAW